MEPSPRSFPLSFTVSPLWGCHSFSYGCINSIWLDGWWKDFGSKTRPGSMSIHVLYDRSCWKTQTLFGKSKSTNGIFETVNVLHPFSLHPQRTKGPPRLLSRLRRTCKKVCSNQPMCSFAFATSGRLSLGLSEHIWKAIGKNLVLAPKKWRCWNIFHIGHKPFIIGLELF